MTVVLFDRERAPTAAPSSSASGMVRSYAFAEGPLGITLHEVRGGTRVAVETVAPHSQAESQMLPVGSMVMAINGRSATGLRVAAVGKWLAQASRPLNLMVVHPDGAAPPPATSSANAPAAAPAAAGPAPRRDGPGPPVEYEFGDKLGLSLQDVEGGEGGVSIAAVAPGGAAEANGVPVGGHLLRIGGTDTRTLGKAQVGKLLGKAARPLILTVCAPPPPPPVSLPFVFGEGPMGFTLVDGPDGRVYIKDVQGGSQAAAMSVPAGGMLRKINAIDLDGSSRAVVGKLFGKVGRPMTIFIEVEGDSDAARAAKAKADAEAAHAAAQAAAERRQAHKAADKSGTPNKRGGARPVFKANDRKEEARVAAAAARAEQVMAPDGFRWLLMASRPRG